MSLEKDCNPDGNFSLTSFAMKYPRYEMPKAMFVCITTSDEYSSHESSSSAATLSYLPLPASLLLLAYLILGTS